MAASSTALRMLYWMAQPPDRGWLREHSYAVIEWDDWRARYVAPARAIGVVRDTLDSPAADLLARYHRHSGVALTGVRLDCLDELRDLLGYALEPAWRAGCRMLVHADRTLDELEPGQLHDEGFGFPWTLERARFVAGVMTRASRAPAPASPPSPARPLDLEQLRAVGAHDGVVQVVAPAGSGKTTVLIERVRELLRRGAAPERILCVTFNAAAAQELRDRLTAAGVAGVAARTFHSIGRGLLSEEGLLVGEPRTHTVAGWRRLAWLAQREAGDDGIWFEPPDAREQISELKLGKLLTAAEWRRRAPADGRGRTLAALYARYERELRAERCHDFDDQIFLAVRALREGAGVRARWQARFDRILVDEYQDIEPAQELLVQILAAPQDSLFVVGDADQVLYGWRRASAARMVALDQTYPGLERAALAVNYRCPAEVVARSAQLIAHNRIRFPQQIGAAPGRDARDGELTLQQEASCASAAAAVARLLAARARGDVVVLARTTRLLRDVALACVEPPIAISAPTAVFELRGALGVVRAHLQLAAHPELAEAQDVLSVLRNPSRGLPPDAEVAVAVAANLRAGGTWAQALGGVPDPRGRLADAAVTLDRIHAIADATRFVRALRTDGGLDDHFTEHERTFGATEQTEIETLEDCERDAEGLTIARYAGRLRSQHDDLQAIRDDEHGIELTTVHGAKGREWPTVIVVGFDEQQLPHQRALALTAQQRAAGEGLEAERRIAYVAMTRAKDRLHLFATRGQLSPFAWQAGLACAPPPPAREPLPATTRGQRAPAPPPDIAGQVEAITRVGAKYAVRTAPDRRIGLRVAAWAIRHRLVNADNTAGSATAGAYLGAIPDLAGGDLDMLLRTGGVSEDAVLSRLPARERIDLADALDAAARG